MVSGFRNYYWGNYLKKDAGRTPGVFWCGADDIRRGSIFGAKCAAVVFATGD